MNTSHLPGFTAEDALYVSAKAYNAAGLRAAAPSGLQPQLRRRPPNDDCIPGCVCVSPINCPCCSSMPWPWPWPGPDPTMTA